MILSEDRVTNTCPRAPGGAYVVRAAKVAVTNGARRRAHQREGRDSPAEGRGERAEAEAPAQHRDVPGGQPVGVAAQRVRAQHQRGGQVAGPHHGQQDRGRAGLDPVGTGELPTTTASPACAPGGHHRRVVHPPQRRLAEHQGQDVADPRHRRRSGASVRGSSWTAGAETRASRQGASRGVRVHQPPSAATSAGRPSPRPRTIAASRPWARRWATSSSGTSSARRLLRPPVSIGPPSPASRTRAATTGSGARPRPRRRAQQRTHQRVRDPEHPAVVAGEVEPSGEQGPGEVRQRVQRDEQPARPPGRRAVEVVGRHQQQPDPGARVDQPHAEGGEEVAGEGRVEAADGAAVTC